MGQVTRLLGEDVLDDLLRLDDRQLMVQTVKFEDGTRMPLVRAACLELRDSIGRDSLESRGATDRRLRTIRSCVVAAKEMLDEIVADQDPDPRLPDRPGGSLPEHSGAEFGG